MITFLIVAYIFIGLIAMLATYSHLDTQFPTNPNVLKWAVAVFYGAIWILVPFIQAVFRVGLDKK